MTWDAHHRREPVLRAVAAAADARLDGILPTDLSGVDGVFTSDADLAGALQMRWHTRLTGELERRLSVGADDQAESAVVDAWLETARAMAGVRLVLDRLGAEPPTSATGTALHRATRQERAMLAALAGLGSGDDTHSVVVGARLEEAARRRHHPEPRSGDSVPDSTEASPRLMARLRAVIAA